MSQYNANIEHMKRNLYKRLTLHRGMYLNIDISKHNPRECNTHSRIRTHTTTQYSYISLQIHKAGRTITGKSMLMKQHAS